MKTKLLMIIVFAMAIPITESFAEEIPPEYHVGKIEWDEKCIAAASAGTIRVVDPDMNHDFAKADHFQVSVTSEQFGENQWSKYDTKTIDVQVTELGESTGIFEGTVFFATPGEASGHRIPVWENDKAVATYVDKTTPSGKDLELVAHATIDFMYKPLHQNKQRYDDSKFVYNSCIASELSDNAGIRKDLSWLVLDIQSPLKQKQTGLENHEILCRENLTLIYRANGNVACVKPESVDSLLARGWVTEESSLSVDVPISDIYPYQLFVDNYKENDIVLLGDVISFTSNPHPEPNRYDVSIETNYKNQRASVITVYGSGERNDLSYDPTFAAGDRVFLYVTQTDGKYMIGNYSTKLDFDCGAGGLVPPRSMIDPDYFPRSAPASPFGVTFDGHSGDDVYSLGDMVMIKFVAESSFPAAKTERMKLDIVDPLGNTVFSKDSSAPAPGCYSQVPFSWTFEPDSLGTYHTIFTKSTEVHLDHYSVVSDDHVVDMSFLVK